MIDLHLRGKRSCLPKTLLVGALFVFFPIEALGANSIAGSVRNETRGEPAAGDEVILIGLDRGIQEEARAKTDQNGMFTLTVQYSEKAYLVRVVHQGVSYDQQASAGQELSLQVFDAVPQVRGITSTIEILRTGTNGNLLHVSDLVEIKNASSPPLTQAGERTFEVYLPSSARLDSVLAAGPGKIGEMISASPVPREPGHYTVDFPLRPGATKFAFNYDLPYESRVTFHTRRAYPLQQLAVMTPPNMKFSSRSPAFEILAADNSRYEVHAANELRAGEGPEFELSGVGAFPPVGDQASSHQFSLSQAHASPAKTPPVRAILPSLASIDSRLKQTPPPAQLFVLVGVTSVLLAACALLIWRGRKVRISSDARTAAPPTHHRQSSAA
jgi:hypothetical protein